MPSERVQRQIDELLREAEAAIRAADWERVRDRANAVIAMDTQNQDAKAFLDAAESSLGGPPRRRRAPEVEPQWETCQIEWGVTSQLLGSPAPFSKNYFWADVTSPAHGTHAGGSSPKFGVGFAHGLGMWLERGGRGTNWDDRLPSNDGNTVAAHRALVNMLLQDGWNPTEFRGGQWWEYSFRRRVRTEEDGWKVLETVRNGDAFWHHAYEGTSDDELSEEGQEAVQKGMMQKDGSGGWLIREDIVIEWEKEDGSALLSIVTLDHDGEHHRLAFHKESGTTAET